MAEAGKSIGEFTERLESELGKAIVGQGELLEETAAALLTGGHVLLEGVPGTAKTLLVRALGRALDLSWGRIQFTPDLMPADVTGSYVYRTEQAEFEFRRGPVFVNLLLADEVNRAPAKTQSALLEAMEEGAVTVDGERHELPRPFVVFATQNPLEHEGTYPLPEAELDRFLFKSVIDLPGRDEEIEILKRHRDGFDPRDLAAAGIQPVAGPEALAGLTASVREGVEVEDVVLGYAADLVRQTRDWAGIAIGAGPRAAVHLMRAARALAAMRGRDFVLPDDVKRLSVPVLRHRIMLGAEREIEGVTPDDVIRDLVGSLEVPRTRKEQG